MKKLFLLLTMVTMLSTACTEGGVDENDEPQNPTEQPGGNNDGNDDGGNDDGNTDGGGNDDGNTDGGNDDGNDDSTTEEAVFVIDSDGNYIVEANGGEVKVRVTTNLEYSVNIPHEAKSWLSVADTRAIRTETLTFTVSKNETPQERQATVQIKGTDGALLQSVVFKQKKVDESTGGPISVSKGRVNVDFEGGDCELSVKAEYSWVATCSADWITLQTPDGIAGEEPLKFAVQRNTALSERKATITLKNENYNLIQEVYVIQSEFAPVIEVVESVSLEDVACEKFVEVTSNVEYNVTDDADWLTCEIAEGGINLSATANGTLETRSTQVIITPKENAEALSKQISVVQTAVGAQYAIYYTSSDGNVVEPNKQDVFGANLIGNHYKDNQGILLFDAPVTSIGDEAFRDCASLTSITIPDNVTTIRWYAFRDCTSLTSVTIPDSVTSIEGSAFRGCTSLTSITIPDSVNSIKNYTFSDCTSLTSITIPDSVTTIGKYAFEECTSLKDVYVNITDLAAYSTNNVMYEINANKHLLVDGVEITELAIPDSVTTIGWSAFSGCTSLTSITIPDSVTSIGYRAFAGCAGELIINSKNVETDYYYDNRPSQGWLNGAGFTKLIIGGNITSIGRYTFSYCTSLTSITIPDSVTSIGESAFYKCTSLTDVYVNITDLAAYSTNNVMCQIGGSKHLLVDGVEITELAIPDSVTTIGELAFSGCASLTSVTIPDSVTEIGNEAFCICTSLTSVTIGDSVTLIGESAFFYCRSLTSVTIGDSVTSIGYDAFRDCTSLTSVTIPDSVTSIGVCAFYGCTSLTSVTIGDSVTEIGAYTFSGCTSLTSVTIPDSVTSIEHYAFRNCTSLTSITIPDSVTSIGDYMFRECTSLKSVTIGDGVRTIGEYAFSGCTSLKEIYCKAATPPTVDGLLFPGGVALESIYVPRASVEKYRATDPWYYYNITGYDF